MNKQGKLITIIIAFMIAINVLPFTMTETRADEPAQSANGTVSIVRLGGADRFETANKIADEGWKKSLNRRPCQRLYLR